MKRSLIFALLILLCASLTAAAQSQKKQIERIAVQIAEAYKSKNLGSLDKSKLIRGSVQIVVGYVSLDEKEVPDTVRRFRSFRTLERWLDNRVTKGIDNPGRYVREFTGCSRGSCSFDDDRGSLHNQLYLFDISYGYRKGRFFIKSINVWNGD